MTMTTPAGAAVTGRFDIGRVGRETFDIVRTDLIGTYGLAVGLSLIPAVFNMILGASGLIVTRATPGASFGSIFGIWFFLVMVIGLVVSVLIYGALGYGAVEHLQGRKLTIGQKLSAAGAALLPMIGVSILAYIGIVIGTMLIIVPGVFLCTMWAVVLVAAVVDRSGVLGSFSRSAALTKNHRWMIFVLFVIFFLALLVLGLLQLLITKIFAVAGPVGVALAALLSTFVIGGPITAIGATGVGVVYQELRRAKGEFDPGRLAEVFS